MLENNQNQQNQKLLFVSCNYENLKTYIPLLESLEKQYDIYLVAQYVSHGSDKKFNEEVFKKFNGELIESFELGDQASWRLGNRFKSRWYKLIEVFFKTIFIEYKANKKAKEIINRVKPNLIINGGDGRILERHLIEYSEKKNIKSICFQWTLTPISKKSMTEYKLDNFLSTLKLKKFSFFKKIENIIFFFINYILRKFNGIIIFLLNIRAKVKIKTGNSFRIFGQGNSTKLALIGESSRKYQIEMGTPAEKIEIVGHPLYENIFNNRSEKNISDKVKLYKKLNLPLDANFVLWVNGDQKKRYLKFYSDELMFESRKKQLLTILNSNHKIFILFKLHPRGDRISEYKKIESISPRIRIISEINIEDILPFSSALIVRYSMSAIDGILFNIPLISINYPPLPAGNLFNEIGGTIHIKDNNELESIMLKLFSKDTEITNLINKKRNYFLHQHLSINPINKDIKRNESIERFQKLISELIKK